MVLSAVIFDLYGTLLDISHDSRPYRCLAGRAEDSRSAMNAALTREHATLAEFASSIGLGLQDDVGDLQATLQSDLVGIAPFADTFAALDSLSQRGIKIAVISNLATPYKQPFYELGIAAYAEVAMFSCELGLRKPDPKIFRMTLQRLGVPADETIMVGDSLKSDVDGAASVGVRGWHLDRSRGGFRSNDSIPSLLAMLDRLKIPA